MRNTFLKKLDDLIKKVSDMGNTVDSVILDTINVIKSLDSNKASEIIESDSIINRMEHEIERDCLNIIALQQPIAGDLRNVTGCLKIITDIERIADHCTDICEIILSSKLSIESACIKQVINIMENVYYMFKSVLIAFISRNVDDSVSICKLDDKIDLLFSDILLNICGVISKDSSKVMPEIDLIFIAKYAERIADHCTNIAEWIIYMETNQHPELN